MRFIWIIAIGVFTGVLGPLYIGLLDPPTAGGSELTSTSGDFTEFDVMTIPQGDS